MSCDQVTLSTVASVFNGKTPSRSEQREEGYPVLKIKDITEDRKFKGEFKSFVDEDVAKKSESKYLELFDSLILNAAHNADYVGSKQYRAEKSVVGALPTGEWLIVRTNNKKVLDPVYLNYWLRSGFCRHQIKLLVKGIHLYPKDVNRLEIPLPPLPIQKQIAAVLEKADSLRQQCQQMETELSQLAQSVFLEMFGDPVANTKGWPVKRFDEVCKSQLGKMLSSKAKVGSNPKKYLRNANIRWRKISFNDLLEMDFNEKEQKKFELRYGDLLVCEGGDVGRCAIWRDQVSDCYYQKALHRVRVDTDVLTPEYVQEYFFWNSKLGGLSSSVSEVTFSHLTGEKLSKLKIPVPPIELQTKYTSFIQGLEKYQLLNAGMKGKYSDVFNSLMQQAFSGELELKDVA